MSARFAILCPGQGGQHAAMFDLVRADPRGAQALSSVGLDAHLPIPVDTILQDDDLLFANRYAQPLIVAAGLAAWRTIRSQLPPPELVAGYSVGELTAYGVADALIPSEAVALACRRAQAMDAAMAHEPRQGMMSVRGISREKLEDTLRGLNAWVAIDTGFDTAIVGGDMDSLQSVQRSSEAIGGKTGMLPVGLASHTPLMEVAVAPFTEALSATDLRDPAIPVLAGISGQAVQDRTTAIVTLRRQLTQTIRWKACMEACNERGIRIALELGPGTALSRMFREQYPHIECRSLADFRSMGGAVRWLHSRIG
jgi:[acyl-carrier-protein] S-malonyltransferase